MRTRSITPLVSAAMLVSVILLLPGCWRGVSITSVLTATNVSGDAPLEVVFDLSHCLVPEGKNVSYVLDFGDGTDPVSGGDLNVTVHHTYVAPGSFIAALTIADGKGHVDTAFLEILVSLDESLVGTEVGDVAPDFTAPTIDGNKITLSELRGQVVLIEFWESCSCKKSVPYIYGLHKTYAANGLVVIAVSTDSQKDDAIRYLEKNGYSDLICIWEPGGESTRVKLLFDVDWIPRAIVIDRMGVIRYNAQPNDLALSFVEALLFEMLP